MRRVFVFAVTGLAMLGVVGIASSDDTSPVREDRVFGGYHSEGNFGGTGMLPIPPRDASFDVHGTRDGASGKFHLGRNDTSELLVEARITCISAIGNAVVLGGVITVDNTPTPTLGEDFLWHAVDNGGPGGAVRDRVSAVWKDADGTLGQGAFPGTLPRKLAAKVP